LTITATYSPDDNKLRLYASTRLPKDLYDRVRAAGFIWAPKQDLFVAPTWTPEREDLALELAGEIDDEDTSLTERAEERAERFDTYSDKRAQDADSAHKAVAAIADGIPFGQPILVGHHSERHARRDAEKIENGMRRAVKMWETSKYWTDRAKGALRHAKYKELPAVRARRIKTIEADARKMDRADEESAATIRAFALIDQPEKWKPRPDGTTLTREERAAFIAGRYRSGGIVKKDEAAGYGTGYWDAYDLLRLPAEERYRGVPTVSIDDVIAAVAKAETGPAERRARWRAHYENRLAYERAMLAEAGGLVAESTKFEVGGRVQRRGQWFVIVRVNPGSVSVAGHFCATITHDEISAYEPPTEELAAAAKKAVKLPPLCNYPGEGFQHMTRAELDARPERKWSDFPKIGKVRATETHAAHRRHQCRGAGQWSVVGVFVTDEKRKDPPPFTPPSGPTLRPERTQAPVPAPQEAIGPAKDSGPDPAAFDAMKASLRAGVKAVSAPQLFPTPPALAARMVELADIQPGAQILEPSAGTGRILTEIKRRHPEADVTAVEIRAHLADVLRNGYRVPTYCEDFLTFRALPTYDRIIMNPPFENASDVKHIERALSLLNPGGRLVALCANGPRQNEQLRHLAGTWEELPAGTFDGTNVRAALLVIDKAPAPRPAPPPEPAPARELRPAPRVTPRGAQFALGFTISDGPDNADA
jgi:phospholipid N-methyltransferase